ncbi:MAG TPA: hypothetical protein VNJ28_03125, partial [Candidatus Limnocylindrales bacterium]|nr:hypothetical protein [Candidatus Limnocylindrales bacterium]
RAPPEVLAGRFASSAHRPLFGEPLAVLSEQARRREPLFAALGGLAVDVDRAPPGAVVRSILRALRRWSPDGARSSGARAPAGREDGAGDNS